MTERAALLRSVLVAPADDAPRLVYADWLDENGEAERAEFIRVQCRLDALAYKLMSDEDCGDPNCPGCVEGRALRKRERAILREWIRWPNGAEGTREAWWYEQMAAAGIRLHDLPTYRRGFVAHVELTTADFLGGPCETCAGTRMVPDEEGQAYDERIGRRVMIPRQKFCPDCHGKGTVDGIAAALFAAQPVVSVRLTDREPTCGIGGVHWGMASSIAIVAREPGMRCLLPRELFVRLPEFDGREATQIDCPTEDAARAALSAACVHYARNLCGLPPLPLPGPGGRPANPAGG